MCICISKTVLPHQVFFFYLNKSILFLSIKLFTHILSINYLSYSLTYSYHQLLIYSQYSTIHFTLLYQLPIIYQLSYCQVSILIYLLICQSIYSHIINLSLINYLSYSLTYSYHLSIYSHKSIYLSSTLLSSVNLLSTTYLLISLYP